MCATKRALVSTRTSNALNYRAISLAPLPSYYKLFFLVLTFFFIIKKNDEGSTQLLGQWNEFTEVEIPCPARHSLGPQWYSEINVYSWKKLLTKKKKEEKNVNVLNARALGESLRVDLWSISHVTGLWGQTTLSGKKQITCKSSGLRWGKRNSGGAKTESTGGLPGISVSAVSTDAPTP